jgi:hypothetical protein
LLHGFILSVQTALSDPLGCDGVTTTSYAALKASPVKVGTVTIGGTVNGDDPKYSSDRIADEYWKLHIAENGAYETIY